jgi:hypothetical protein
MLLQRFHVFLLVLMVVTVLHHLFKDRIVIVTSPTVTLPKHIRIPPLIRKPIGTPLLLKNTKNDITVLYAFDPIRKKAYRPRTSVVESFQRVY